MYNTSWKHNPMQYTVRILPGLLPPDQCTWVLWERGNQKTADICTHLLILDSECPRQPVFACNWVYKIQPLHSELSFCATVFFSPSTHHHGTSRNFEAASRFCFTFYALLVQFITITSLWLPSSCDEQVFPVVNHMTLRNGQAWPMTKWLLH